MGHILQCIRAYGIQGAIHHGMNREAHPSRRMLQIDIAGAPNFLSLPPIVKELHSLLVSPPELMFEKIMSRFYPMSNPIAYVCRR